MQWSPQQSHALESINRWFKDKGGPQVYKLFGYAGTGKTTLAKEIATAIGDGVLFGAYTGKAALVLSKKGCPASTLHSLIYKPVQDELTGEVEFILNPDSLVATAPLLIVDEVSMVGPELGADLLSYGTRVLVLGDPFQLPPVNGTGFFTQTDPDLMLTEIHRQAQDNPIIRMSIDIREGRGLQVGEYGSSFVRRRDTMDRDELGRLVLSADQVICGRNKTRMGFNQRMRQLKSITDPMPVKGERLICLKNNRTKGFLNGGMWSVKHSWRNGQDMGLKLDSLDTVDTDIEAQVRREFFVGTEDTLDWREKKRSDEFTFGYAITCHKSQGSQYDEVLVFDESSAFRDNAARWQYTAVTRAAEQVGIVV